MLKPAERLARDGFTVDETFRSQTAANETRFRYFPDTARLFLPGGKLPVVGSTFKNPDLARTYAELGRKGTGLIYRGDLGKDIVRTVNHPPVDPASGWNARPGALTTKDLAAYRAKIQAPTRTTYRGLGVYSIAPSSSGGTTVGEALNILENSDLSKLSRAQYLHRYIEASRIAFADRGRWVGDPAYEDVPTKQLLSQRYADSRACLVKDDAVLTSPLAPRRPAPPRPLHHRRQGRAHHVRGRGHHPPHRRRQVGQRRRLHPHHRTDRRQRHHRPRPRLPAQQRADRLLLRPPPTRPCTTRTCPAPASGPAPPSRRPSCSTGTTGPSSRSARPAAPPSSPPSCRP
ncbi:hypothetical protein GCM10020256_10010 [Streptomyces thermocoprophilus]